MGKPNNSIVNETAQYNHEDRRVRRSYSMSIRTAEFGSYNVYSQGPPSSVVIQYNHKDRRVRRSYSTITRTAEFGGRKV